MRADPLVLVTGSGGFIGNRFVEVVYLTRFARVRAGARTWAGAARIARFPVDIVACDILDRQQVAAAMDGVDAVIHCAVGDRQVVVDGTRNVLDAAARAGVSRVIHFSTAEVYGPSVHGRVHEIWPHTPSGSEYADAKIEAERLVWEASACGLPVTVFRPSIVYGPWSEQWSTALAERLQSGHWKRYAEYGDGICNLVYIDDLVMAALSSIHAERAAGEAFNIGGPDLVTWNEYFERFNAALALPALKVQSAQKAKATSMVMGAVRTVAHAGLSRYGDTVQRVYERGGPLASAMKATKRWLNTSPSAREIEQLYSRRAVYDWSKAERLLGYRPTVDLDQGLRLTVDWLRYAGVLNPRASSSGVGAA